MYTSVPEFPQHAAAMAPPAWNRAPITAGLAPGSLFLRLLAYLADIVVIGALVFALSAALIVLGFLSFGASWLLIVPVCMATPALYSGLTLSSRAQATFGMRLFGLSMRPVDGGSIDFLTGAAHALLFYIFGATMTPLVLLVGLFRRDGALLHDLSLRVRLVATWSR